MTIFNKYLGVAFLMDIAKYIYYIPLLIRKLQKRRPSTFTFDNQVHRYFEHPYNCTWMNERAVEIPLAWSEIQLHSSDKILEVGNVLSHYFHINHSVVDKYERRPGVISKDIIDIDFDRKFDCIVSVSTVEHIGWDEFPRKPDKCIIALNKMKQMLSEKGRLFVTLPLGHNLYLDRLLFDGKLNFNRVIFYKRLSRYEWRQVDREQVLDSSYGINYRTTNGLAICLWCNS